MPDVLGRQKDIQYSSRTRTVTDYYRKLHARDLLLKRLLDRLPDDTLEADEKAGKGAARAHVGIYRSASDLSAGRL